mmetsp:Transcript_107150/g.301584  ORF Transcript_107150/g.301584 Transcript_107150/m.301584 type:complete len:259 (-) Transcript_107150:190-966(-)
MTPRCVLQRHLTENGADQLLMGEMEVEEHRILPGLIGPPSTQMVQQVPHRDVLYPPWLAQLEVAIVALLQKGEHCCVQVEFAALGELKDGHGSDGLADRRDPQAGLGGERGGRCLVSPSSLHGGVAIDLERGLQADDAVRRLEGVCTSIQRIRGLGKVLRACVDVLHHDVRERHTYALVLGWRWGLAEEPTHFGAAFRARAVADASLALHQSYMPWSCLGNTVEARVFVQRGRFPTPRMVLLRQRTAEEHCAARTARD